LAKTASAPRPARVWKDLPSKRYGAILLRPPWQEHDDANGRRCLLPADVAQIDIPRLAQANALIAVVTTARWLAPTAELLSVEWGARVVTTLVRVRSFIYSSWPINNNAEYVIVGLIGTPKLPRSKRSTVFKSKSELYEIIDELVPDATGLLCFDTITRTGWESWDPIKTRPHEAMIARTDIPTSSSRLVDNKKYLAYLRDRALK
jgi:N6-adenosine-specific RNA methylase IME4